MAGAIDGRGSAERPVSVKFSEHRWVNWWGRGVRLGQEGACEMVACVGPVECE